MVGDKRWLRYDALIGIYGIACGVNIFYHLPIPFKWGAGILVLILASSGLLTMRRDRLRGWSVRSYGPEPVFAYRELVSNKWKELLINAERLSTGIVVYIPGPKQWEESMPLWAQGRRTEILERLQIAVPPNKYQYCLVYDKP